MILTLFWLKIVLKRIVGLAKTSPLVSVAVIIGVAVLLRSKAVIPLQNSLFAGITCVLFCAGLLTSLKRRDAITHLTRCAKSGNSNAEILTKYFLRRAVLNAFPLLLFDGLILRGTFKTSMTVYLPGAAFFCILFSFCLLRIRHTYYRGGGKLKKLIAVNPRVKSILHDYATPSFMLSAALSIGFMLNILGELVIKNNRLLAEMRHPSLFFVYPLIALGLGCMGIIDAVPHINWRFYAFACPKEYGHHFKTAFLFLIALFGAFILAFIGMLIWFDLRLLPKYLFTLAVILLFPINAAYSSGRMPVKIFGCFAFTGGALWLGIFNAYLLPIVLLPLGYTFWKAKQDYKDWYTL
jgi:hypothetical protein